jgi:hypothetical protein
MDAWQHKSGVGLALELAPATRDGEERHQTLPLACGSSESVEDEEIPVSSPSQQELVARLSEVEHRLGNEETAPLAGQETIPVTPTIHDHHYEGPGPCRAEVFGEPCAAHRDLHRHSSD